MIPMRILRLFLVVVFVVYGHIVHGTSDQQSNIDIQVKSFYLPSQSDIKVNKYVFAYTVYITNHGENGVQLRSRHWQIRDNLGTESSIDGVGVLGMLPYIAPGETFQYTSGAMIQTEKGFIKGNYGMMDTNGTQFMVEIPEFVLNKNATD